jgi:hypothetical protein
LRTYFLVNPAAWHEDIGKFAEALVGSQKRIPVAGKYLTTASTFGLAPARLERVEKAGQAAGITLERQAACGRRKRRIVTFLSSFPSFPSSSL